MSEKSYNFDPDKLKRYMGIRNILQCELAKKAHISKTSMNQFCNGHRNPSKKIIDRIAWILNIESSDLKADGNPVYAGETIEQLEALMNSCYPSVLKHNSPYIKKLLKIERRMWGEILQYMMFQTNSLGELFLCQQVRKLKNLPWLNQNYQSKIHIFYIQNQADKLEYDCFVMFEDWVYAIWDLPEALHFTTMRIVEEEGTEGWFSVMVEQLQEALFDNFTVNMGIELASEFHNLLFLDGDWRWPTAKTWDMIRDMVLKNEQKTALLRQLDNILTDEKADMAFLENTVAYAAKLSESHADSNS